MKYLIVGGTWTNVEENGMYGKSSGLINKIYTALCGCITDKDEVVLYNGGNYNDLQHILNMASNYNVVFWFANVDNSLPKVRDVKEVAPRVMLITSKRNDNKKYTFMELVQRALAAKANLCFEFSKLQDSIFNIRVFDPLGCEWYEGTDIYTAVKEVVNRVTFLSKVTRQSSEALPINENMDTVSRETVNNFLDTVKEHAETFQKILYPNTNIDRFLGNCSLRLDGPGKETKGRCSKGFPSMRTIDGIYVSQRNVDKRFIDADHMVKVALKDGKLFYYGDKKPSVDTPIQVRLYGALPNINFMIHSHTFIKNAPFTNTPIPCGALEEVEEVLSLIDNHYSSRNLDFYVINLKGHGSIIMSSDIEKLKNVNYYGRTLPDIM